MKRTLKRGLKVLEIVKRETMGAFPQKKSLASWKNFFQGFVGSFFVFAIWHSSKISLFLFFSDRKIAKRKRNIWTVSMRVNISVFFFLWQKIDKKMLFSGLPQKEFKDKYIACLKKKSLKTLRKAYSTVCKINKKQMPIFFCWRGIHLPMAPFDKD